MGGLRDYVDDLLNEVLPHRVLSMSINNSGRLNVIYDDSGSLRTQLEVWLHPLGEGYCHRVLRFEVKRSFRK